MPALCRALETRSSPLLIRAAAAELPSVPLEDALDISLALLELEPGQLPADRDSVGQPAGDRAQARLVEAQLAFAALAALPGPSARAGAEALIEIATRYDLRRAEEMLSAWLDRRAFATRVVWSADGGNLAVEMAAQLARALAQHVVEDRGGKLNRRVLAGRLERLITIVESAHDIERGLDGARIGLDKAQDAYELMREQALAELYEIQNRL
jgi:hypothetical protein